MGMVLEVVRRNQIKAHIEDKKCYYKCWMFMETNKHSSHIAIFDGIPLY